MDRFFVQRYCDRCGKDLKNGRIMSMFNTDCICLECADKEKTDKDYKKAVDTDTQQIKQGNYTLKVYGGSDMNPSMALSAQVTDKVFDQIMSIRSEGKYNMFDVVGVQREAYEQGFNELVVFLQEHKDKYVQFIVTGQR